MGQLVFQAILGGQVNLVGPNTASTLNINVPAFAGTMASLASVTANGVNYVNSSGQPTSGSGFVFDGTNVGIGTSTPSSIGGTLSTVANSNTGLGYFRNLATSGIASDQFQVAVAQSASLSSFHFSRFYSNVSSSPTVMHYVRGDGEGYFAGNLLVGTTTAYAPLSVAGSIAPAATPSTSWGIDFASSVAPPNYVTLAAAATYDLATGSGLIVLHNNTNGLGAVFFTYAGVTVKIAGDASIVSGTGGASQIGIIYNSGVGKYRINNGYATSQSIFITTIRTRTAS